MSINNCPDGADRKLPMSSTGKQGGRRGRGREVGVREKQNKGKERDDTKNKTVTRDSQSELLQCDMKGKSDRRGGGKEHSRIV